MSLILSGTDGLSDVDGTAATPAIRGTDANTGIFFPAADTIAFAEGGAEAMRLDSSGNLGVGTSSPTQKLDVAGQVTISSGNGYLWGNGAVQIYSNSSYLRFRTASTDRLEIDTSGNLGVGVTPTASSGLYKVVEVGASGNSVRAGTSDQDLYVSCNLYYNSGWKFGGNGYGALYNQYHGTHSWAYTSSNSSGAGASASSLTTAMTLDASGNLLVGTTTSPSYSGYNALVLNSATNGGLLDIQVAGSRIGSLQAGSSTELRLFANTSVVTTLYGGGSERARITSGGYLKVSNSGTYANVSATFHEINNSADNAEILYMRSTATSNPYGMTISWNSASPNDTTRYFLRCDDSTAQRFTARSNGGLANYSANDVNLSDRREKTNFAPAGDYLAKICAIPVQTFNYIDQNLEEDDGLTLGVVAQDVQAVAPELVMESNWASKDDEPKMRLSIYQTDLQYALMKCIQEQQALITQLTARITALESA